MTEAEARDLLCRHDGWGGIQRWIAGRHWTATPKGWIVEGELQGSQFQVEPVPGGVRVSAAAPESAPATWVVVTR